MHNPSFPFPEGWTGSDRHLLKKTSVRSNLGGSVGSAEFARKSARFFFQRADGELRTTVAIAEILAAPLFEPTGALALRDMDEIMQNQFAVVPDIDADNQRVTKTRAAGVLGKDTGSSRDFGELRTFRQRNSIDDQHSHVARIFYAGKHCIRNVARA